MDNVPYHSRQTGEIPKAKARKELISSFLNNMGVTYPPSALKKDLLVILKGLNLRPIYVVDEMAKRFGHTVIRLPPYYCTFNPIELIWSNIKGGVRKRNVTPTLSETVLDVIREVVAGISPEIWSNCVRHVKDIENNYRIFLSHSCVIILEDTSSEDDSGDDNF